MYVLFSRFLVCVCDIGVCLQHSSPKHNQPPRKMATNTTHDVLLWDSLWCLQNTIGGAGWYSFGARNWCFRKKNWLWSPQCPGRTRIRNSDLQICGSGSEINIYTDIWNTALHFFLLLLLWLAEVLVSNWGWGMGMKPITATGKVLEFFTYSFPMVWIILRVSIWTQCISSHSFIRILY